MILYLENVLYVTNNVHKKQNIYQNVEKIYMCAAQYFLCNLLTYYIRIKIYKFRFCCPCIFSSVNSIAPSVTIRLFCFFFQGFTFDQT